MKKVDRKKTKKGKAEELATFKKVVEKIDRMIKQASALEKFIIRKKVKLRDVLLTESSSFPLSEVVESLDELRASLPGKKELNKHLWLSSKW